MLKKKKIYVLILGVIYFLFFSTLTVSAQNTTKTNLTNNLIRKTNSTNSRIKKTNAFYYSEPTTATKKPNFLWTIVKSLFWLGLFAVGLYYLFKYIMKKQNKGNVNNDSIKLIAQNSIALGKYVSIVKILNSFYVLGIADNGITLIKEITDKFEIDSLNVLSSQLDASIKQKLSFQESFQKIFNQFGNSAKKSSSKTSRQENFKFMKKQQERLNKLGRRTPDE